MAYDDAPEVDRNSEMCENSENATRLLFTRENGFVLRGEYPDFGVDFEIELRVKPAGGVTGNKFPLQLKSCEQVARVTVRTEEFISQEIRTSRLGYFCRKKPSYGYILVYDIASGTMYYDYVPSIYQRVMETKAGDEWKKQEKVTIHIPAGNILTQETVAHVHTRMMRLFQNHDTLIVEQGNKYGIPVLGIGDSANIGEGPALKQELNRVNDLLREAGHYLINQSEFGKLLVLLGQLPYHELTQEFQFLFLAFIANAQTGNYVEASLFRNLLSKRTQEIPQKDLEIWLLLDAKIGYVLGEVDAETQIHRLEEIGQQVRVTENILFNKVHILHLKLLVALRRRDKLAGLRSDVEQLLTESSAISPQDDRSMLARLSLADLLSAIGLNSFTKSGFNKRIRESLGHVQNDQQTLQAAVQAFDTFMRVASINEEIKNYGVQNDRELIAAVAQLHSAAQAFQLIFAFYQINRNSLDTNTLQMLSAHYWKALSAQNTFSKLHTHMEAYQALHWASEIAKLYKLVTGQEIDTKNYDKINELSIEHHACLGIAPFQSVVDKHIEDSNSMVSDEEFIRNASSSQIQNYAETIAESINLPAERIINVVNELRAYQLFQKNKFCRNLEFVSTSRAQADLGIAYSVQDVYIIGCRVCGVSSFPHISTEYILQRIDRSKCYNR